MNILVFAILAAPTAVMAVPPTASTSLAAAFTRTDSR